MVEGDIKMNKNNISAIITAVAVISLITGFGIYFNFYSKYYHNRLSAQKQLENSVISISNKKWKYYQH